MAQRRRTLTSEGCIWSSRPDTVVLLGGSGECDDVERSTGQGRSPGRSAVSCRSPAGAGRDDETSGGIREEGRTVDALAPAADEGRDHAAKCSGEALVASDPEVSEWGNPPGVLPGYRMRVRGARGELKHLSTCRKREDSLSSGERTGRSPNRNGERASRRCR